MENREFWPFLFFLGLLFFNWPFMSIFKDVLPYYVFIVWGLFIIIIGLSIRLRKRKKGG
ncbi:MAG: hypothetical protein M0Z59_07520 [Nitrospiraceae bacterium]|nr:hypothetical protein [Nitrospiraceae bacterium]